MLEVQMIRYIVQWNSVGNNAPPAWVALAGMLSDLSILVHMTYAHALADLYVV